MIKINTTSRYDRQASTKRLPWEFWVVLGYFVVVAVFVVCWFFFVQGPVKQQLTEAQTTSLTTTNQACAEALSTSTDAQKFVTETTKDSNLRMTIIAQDGTVIADSELDSARLENHLQREEVQEALQGETGIAQRDSQSDNTERLYIANRATYLGKSVILRISEPLEALEQLNQTTAQVATFLVVLGIMAAIIMLIVSLKQARHPFKRLQKVRTDFVANASHELKTPVAGIRLLSEGISSAAISGDVQTLLLFTERLDSEAQRLQRLVTDLLDLSRLENEETPVTRTIDLHSEFITSALAHQAQAREKGLALRVVDLTLPNERYYATMEATDAALILNNLIENAIHYTEEGTVTATFKADVRSIIIAIEDTGIGIPQADQSRIFERFYRVDKARSREAGGTGLGLSLVRHAVSRAHGTITLESTLNKGSCFTVKIPRA